MTFLFTDIEGSTRLLNELGDRYAVVLDEHRRVMRSVFARHGGVEIDTQGDSFFVAFARASAALGAAEEAQEAFAEGPVRVRMGLHTGEPVVGGEGYVGIDVHRAARIASAGHGGQVLISQTTRDLLGSDLLLRDLGEHRLKDLIQPERIYQLGSAEFAPITSLNQTNLPVQPALLVGRDRELVEVLELLRVGQLLTLTGPGGAGKTRLALQAAAELVDAFRDGVWFVPLAALRDSVLVMATVAQTLSLEAPLSVEEQLRDKETLLVLDNFEQLLDAAGVVATLLEWAPNVKLLVTSREPLRIMGEQVYPLPPLRDEEAVVLFEARARAVKPSFASDDHVVEICRRLDNLPLALELAAARISILAPEALLSRLDRRLVLLTVPRRDVRDHHRTLRATLDWSYDLLDENERRMFTRLAVFVGGFTLDAAADVAECDLDAIQSLADKSLLRPADDGRFFMLETIREYALERLQASGEAAELGRRHAEWHLGWVSQLSEIAVPRMVVASCERELNNLRAALGFLLDAGDVDASLRMAAELEPLWLAAGHATEGRGWLRRALVTGEGARERRALALLVAGWLANHQSDYPEALALLEESLEITRGDGDARRTARATGRLGVVCAQQGDYEAARTHFQEALTLYTELGDDAGKARVVNYLGILSGLEGDLTSARSWHEENLRVQRELGDRLSTSATLTNLGLIAIFQREPNTAGALLEEALTLSRELEDDFQVAIVLANLGRLASQRGQIADARRHFADALQTFTRSGAPSRCAECLEGLAGVALATNDSAKAARLLAAAASTRERTGGRLSAPEQAAFDDLVVVVRNRLEPAEFALAWQTGHEMTLDNAVADALAGMAAP